MKNLSSEILSNIQWILQLNGVNSVVDLERETQKISLEYDRLLSSQESSLTATRKIYQLAATQNYHHKKRKHKRSMFLFASMMIIGIAAYLSFYNMTDSTSYFEEEIIANDIDTNRYLDRSTYTMP